MHIQETVNLGNYRLGLWIPDGTDRLKKTLAMQFVVLMAI